MLKELPKHFEILIGSRKEKYILPAIIDYKGPRHIRKSNQELGHFTTLCLSVQIRHGCNMMIYQKNLILIKQTLNC